MRWFPLAHHPQFYHTRAETKWKIQRRGMPWMQLRRWATRLLLMGGGRSAQGAKWASSALVQGPLTFAVFAQARPNFVKSDLKKCYLDRNAPLAWNTMNSALLNLVSTCLHLFLLLLTCENPIEQPGRSCCARKEVACHDLVQASREFQGRLQDQICKCIVPNLQLGRVTLRS